MPDHGKRYQEAATLVETNKLYQPDEAVALVDPERAHGQAFFGRRAKARAPSTAHKPTPPKPITATLVPACTRAVFTTAPTPVMTAQPNKDASTGSMPASILTQDRRDTTA